MFLNLILIAVYPLLWLVRIVNAIIGADPLRLKKPRGDSFWVDRTATNQSLEYLSEASAVEGSARGGIGWIPVQALRWLSRFFAPSEALDHRSASVEREREIPDEVYTLW